MVKGAEILEENFRNLDQPGGVVGSSVNKSETIVSQDNKNKDKQRQNSKPAAVINFYPDNFKVFHSEKCYRFSTIKQGSFLGQLIGCKSNVDTG